MKATRETMKRSHGVLPNAPMKGSEDDMRPTYLAIAELHPREIATVFHSEGITGNRHFVPKDSIPHQFAWGNA